MIIKNLSVQLKLVFLKIGCVLYFTLQKNRMNNWPCSIMTTRNEKLSSYGSIHSFKMIFCGSRASYLMYLVLESLSEETICHRVPGLDRRWIRGRRKYLIRKWPQFRSSRERPDQEDTPNERSWPVKGLQNKNKLQITFSLFDRGLEIILMCPRYINDPL